MNYAGLLAEFTTDRHLLNDGRREDGASYEMILPTLRFFQGIDLKRCLDLQVLGR